MDEEGGEIELKFGGLTEVYDWTGPNSKPRSTKFVASGSVAADPANS